MKRQATEVLDEEAVANAAVENDLIGTVALPGDEVGKVCYKIKLMIFMCSYCFLCVRFLITFAWVQA